MRLLEAIRRVDDLVNNAYLKGEKVKWISELDGMAHRTVLTPHGVTEPFPGYTEETPDDTYLMIPAPYDDAYVLWLESKIHYYNGEYTRYNNAAAAFGSVFQAYANEYNRTHSTGSTSFRG